MMRESLRRLTSEERMGSPSPSPAPARRPPCPARRPPGTRRVRIELLDGTQLELQVDRKAKGAVLLDLVCEQLGVVEPDYFGLLHACRGDPRVWVDLHRRLAKTFKNEPWEVKFAVKFYPQEPTDLQDDVTRDHLLFAVRRDLIEGRLTCSFITQALLGSYILQAERGDMEDDDVTAALLQEHQVAPAHRITPELGDKVAELYKLHKGQSPAEAVLNYLENAKKLPLYGAALHCAQDSDHVDLLLGVCAGGVSVYRDGLLMNRFPWAKLTKICYSKRLYSLKLRPSEFDEFETTLSFAMPSTRGCKKLWRCSVEHHMFFRRAEPVPVKRMAAFPALGSRRLSCRRTLRQLRSEPLADVYAQLQRTAIAAS